METREQTTTIDYLEANVIAWARAIAEQHGVKTMLQHKEQDEGAAFMLQLTGETDESTREALKQTYDDVKFSLAVSHQVGGKGIGKMFYFFPKNPDFIKLEAILPGWRSLMIDAVLVRVPVTKAPPVQVQAPFTNDAPVEHETLPADFLQATRNSGWIMNQVIRGGVLHDAGIKAGAELISPLEADLLLSGAVNQGRSFMSIHTTLEEKAGIRIIKTDAERKIIRVSLEVPLALFKRFADDELQEEWAKYIGDTSSSTSSSVDERSPASGTPIVTRPKVEVATAKVQARTAGDHCGAINKIIRKKESTFCAGQHPRSSQPHFHSRLVWQRDREAIVAACECAGYVVFSEASSNDDKIILCFNLGSSLAFIGAVPALGWPPKEAVPQVAHPEGGPGPQEIFARKVVQALRKHNRAVVDLNTDDVPMNARATIAGLYIRWQWMDDEALVKFIMEAQNG